MCHSIRGLRLIDEDRARESECRRFAIPSGFMGSGIELPQPPTPRERGPPPDGEEIRPKTKRIQQASKQVFRSTTDLQKHNDERDGKGTGSHTWETMGKSEVEESGPDAPFS